MLLGLAPHLFGEIQDQFNSPFQPINSVRLQITPTLDGVMGREEWDPITEQIALQWEPGKIHIGGTLPKGRQVIVSVDLKGDGWLIGNDNYQYQVWVDENGAGRTTVSQLDATRREGPIWIARGELTSLSAINVSAGADTDFFEATFRDPGLGTLPSEPRDVWMRVDSVDSGAEIAPTLSRLLSKLRFDRERAVALPVGMRWGVQAKTRAVIPGEAFRIRYNFNGGEEYGVRSISMRSEGAVEEQANRLDLLFPKWDNKGRAFVDYATTIEDGAATGYRVARATMQFLNGPDATIQTSYRVAPLMDFKLQRTVINGLPENNTFRLPYVLQLYTRQNASGLIRIEAPEGWEVVKGNDSKFALLGNQNAELRTMDLRVPADAKGTYPIRITGQVKDSSVTQTVYVTIR